MQKVLGLFMLSVGIGIIIGILISVDWIGMCIAAGLICCGFRLFCK